MAVAPCTYCRSPGADLFDPNGAPICQTCDTGFRAQALQLRASAAEARDPIGAGMTFASPGKLMLVGGSIMGFALLFGAAEFFFLGVLHIKLVGLMLVVGFGAFARGGMA